EPAQLAAGLLLQLAQLLLEVARGALLERAQPQVAVAGLEHAALDRGDLHHVARDRERLRALEALAEDADRDLAAALAAHELDRLEQGHALGVLAVLDPVGGLHGRADRRDLVLRLDPGAPRRR